MYLKVLRSQLIKVKSQKLILGEGHLPFKLKKSFDDLLLIRFTDNFTDIFADFSFHFAFRSSKLINVT